DGAIAVLVAVIGGGNTAEVGDGVLDLGLHDHLLALENAAEEEPDDDQHDGDLDQRKAARAVMRFHCFLPCWSPRAAGAARNLTQLRNNGLRDFVEVLSAPARPLPRPRPLAPLARQALLEGLQPSSEKARLARVLDGAAGEQAAEHD